MYSTLIVLSIEPCSEFLPNRLTLDVPNPVQTFGLSLDQGESPAHPDPPAPFAHMHKKQELAVNNLSIEIYMGDIFFSSFTWGQDCKCSYSKNELCLLSSWTFHASSPTKCFFSFCPLLVCKGCTLHSPDLCKSRRASSSATPQSSFFFIRVSYPCMFFCLYHSWPNCIMGVCSFEHFP